MYQKILVPLDGSKLAESVLSHVESVAKGCGTEEVILVSVTERIVGYRSVGVRNRPLGLLQADSRGLRSPLPVTQVPVVVGKKQAVAQRYLERIARRLEKKKLKVRTKVLLGHPAEEIISFAESNGAGLILMASHGRSGVGRWAYGSIADKILRTSGIPVLMVRALAPEPVEQ
ncbi:universal stress protein [Chloroflexota bacterium]